ncbi:MAG: hypothetical protein ACJAUY_001198 [Cognaticolwellia sp.]|jgi:hypothetical protein
MNRKKKINQTLKSKLKKMNAKLQNSNKPKYVSKAERAAIAANEAEGSDVSSNEATPDNSADSLADNSAENNANNDAKNDAK